MRMVLLNKDDMCKTYQNNLFYREILKFHTFSAHYFRLGLAELDHGYTYDVYD